MEGYVRTEELNSRKLEAGAIIVIYDKDMLEICTLQHLNPQGSWVVMGQTFDSLVVPARAELCKLVVLTDQGVYPLKFSQWDKAIKNGEVNNDESVTFDLIPVNKYREGKYIKICTTCSTQFMGGRVQSSCRKCSDADVTAQIQVKKKVKPKRPRIKSTEDIKALMLTSFQMGMRAPASKDYSKEFDIWLEKQF